MNYFTLLFLTFAFSVSFAQEKPPLPEYTIYAVQDSINIDGLLEEPAWPDPYYRRIFVSLV